MNDDLDEQLHLWLKEGFTEHEAYKWHYRNYTLEEALVWKKHGFKATD